jgi:hypothetical protein
MTFKNDIFEALNVTIFGVLKVGYGGFTLNFKAHRTLSMDFKNGHRIKPFD